MIIVLSGLTKKSAKEMGKDVGDMLKHQQHNAEVDRQNSEAEEKARKLAAAGDTVRGGINKLPFGEPAELTFVEAGTHTERTLGDRSAKNLVDSLSQSYGDKKDRLTAIYLMVEDNVFNTELATELAQQGFHNVTVYSIASEDQDISNATYKSDLQKYGTITPSVATNRQESSATNVQESSATNVQELSTTEVALKNLLSGNNPFMRLWNNCFREQAYVPKMLAAKFTTAKQQRDAALKEEEDYLKKIQQDIDYAFANRSTFEAGKDKVKSVVNATGDAVASVRDTTVAVAVSMMGAAATGYDFAVSGVSSAVNFIGNVTGFKKQTSTAAPIIEDNKSTSEDTQSTSEDTQPTAEKPVNALTDLHRYIHIVMDSSKSQVEKDKAWATFKTHKGESTTVMIDKQSTTLQEIKEKIVSIREQYETNTTTMNNTLQTIKSDLLPKIEAYIEKHEFDNSEMHKAKKRVAGVLKEYAEGNCKWDKVEIETSKHENKGWESGWTSELKRLHDSAKAQELPPPNEGLKM